jgi:hypothetical protein
MDVVLGIGAKGPIIVKDKCIKVVDIRDGMPRKDVWQYVSKLEDESLKYALCNGSMDATMEEIPALMRWSIGQCFHECKQYLGMDHYEVRYWPGLRRHMLFTVVSQLFLAKLRRKYGIVVDTPGPAPFTEAPVSTDDCRKPVIKARNDQRISHPRTSACPKEPQQLLTIGLIRAIIQPFLVKLWKTLERVEHLLKSASSTFVNHARAKVYSLVGKEAG